MLVFMSSAVTVRMICCTVRVVAVSHRAMLVVTGDVNMVGSIMLIMI